MIGVMILVEGDGEDILWERRSLMILLELLKRESEACHHEGDLLQLFVEEAFLFV